jgi:hypothetical protein
MHALQDNVKDRKDVLLFGMSARTGETLTAAAVIKLFLTSGKMVNSTISPLPERHHGLPWYYHANTKSSVLGGEAGTDTWSCNPLESKQL